MVSFSTSDTRIIIIKSFISTILREQNTKKTTKILENMILTLNVKNIKVDITSVSG